MSGIIAHYSNEAIPCTLNILTGFHWLSSASFGYFLSFH